MISKLRRENTHCIYLSEYLVSASVAEAYIGGFLQHDNVSSFLSLTVLVSVLSSFWKNASMVMLIWSYMGLWVWKLRSFMIVCLYPWASPITPSSCTCFGRYHSVKLSLSLSDTHSFTYTLPISLQVSVSFCLSLSLHALLIMLWLWSHSFPFPFFCLCVALMHYRSVQSSSNAWILVPYSSFSASIGTVSLFPLKQHP